MLYNNIDTLHITHSDLDGITPIILTKFFNIPVSSYLIIDYEDIYKKDSGEFVLFEKHQIQNIKKIIVTDLSIDLNFLNYIKENSKEYIIIDHHQQSLALKKEKNCIIDDKKSGSLLYFEFLKKNKRIPSIITDYVSLVDTYDMWKDDFSLWEKALNLNRCFWQSILYYRKGYQKYSSFIMNQFSKFLTSNNNFFFNDKEKDLIKKAKLSEEKEILNAKTNMQIRKDEKGYEFAVYHGSKKISIVCNNILKEYKNLKYIINFNTYTGTRKKAINGKVSVRSQKDFDVNLLEGINGHKNAGGGNFSKDRLKKIWFDKKSCFNYKNI